MRKILMDTKKIKRGIYRKPKVYLAMSGGVDSSVAAALLQKGGYSVTGVFMKTWSPPWAECAWPAERRDAMRVAAHLGIPFLTFDFEKEYKRGVIDYMIREYKAGRTPNPDVMCNKEIKFGAFLKRALALGADYIATGHYVKVHKVRKVYKVHKARDENKDQSYFLWTLTQEQLKHCLFPIGEYTKPEVRKLAKKVGLPTAEKKDSQGLCFVGKIDVKDFLKRYLKPKKGAVLNESGEAIGVHDGAVLYTLGERHGFRITKKSPNDTPMYVVKKNTKANTITVAPEMRSPTSGTFEVGLRDINWIAGVSPDSSKKYFARVRYRQPLQPVSLRFNLGGLQKVEPRVWRVAFEKPQIAAAGQSLVLYTHQGEMLGGGVIV